MRVSSLTLVLLTLGAGLGLGFVQYQRLQLDQSLLRVDQAALLQLQIRLAQAEEALAVVERQRLEEQRQLNHVQLETVRIENQLAERHPDEYWSSPPPHWPSWDVASPHVWIRKDTLGKLPVSPFRKDGTIRPEVAQLLVLEPKQVEAINTYLPELASHYQEELLQTAEPIDNVFDMMEVEGITAAVQLQPDPTRAAHYLEQFEAAVRQFVSPQQAELLLKAARPHLDSLFPAQTDPWLYAAVLQPDGNLNIKVRKGGVGSSAVGEVRLEDYIPTPLLPWFEHRLTHGGSQSEP